MLLVSIDFPWMLDSSEARLVWRASEDGSTTVACNSAAVWGETFTDARFLGDEFSFIFASGKGLGVSGSTASSPATSVCSWGGDGLYSSSFSEVGASTFNEFSSLITSAEGIGMPSFASVCEAVGGTGTALRAGARLGTGGALFGIGEAALEDENGEPVRGGAGEPALDRLKEIDVLAR